MNNTIRENLRKLLKTVGISSYSCYIGGSFFFKKNKINFFNGKSDIDIIIVLKKTQHNYSKLLTIFHKDILDKFYNGYFDILNFSHRYGLGRNSYNMKFISIKIFHRITNLQELDFKSFRSESLRKNKSETEFHSNNLESPYLKFTYKEKNIGSKKGYEISYKLKQINKNIFYLSDILAMLLFSTQVENKLKLRSKNKQFLNIIKKCNENELKNLLSYFRNKQIEAPVITKQLALLKNRKKVSLDQ